MKIMRSDDSETIRTLLERCARKHPDHILTIFALNKTGIVWVPVNVHSKGDALQFLVSHAELAAAIVDARYRGQVEPVFSTPIRSI